jgi:hypothetical protein
MPTTGDNFWLSFDLDRTEKKLRKMSNRGIIRLEPEFYSPLDQAPIRPKWSHDLLMRPYNIET